MIHAFLITAYKDLPSLVSLVEQLLAVEDSQIYISVDARRKNMIKGLSEYVHMSLNNSRIHMQFRTVLPGSFEHLEVFLEMASLAIHKKADFFHTITGQCRIVRSIEEFCKFFDLYREKNFMQHFPIPDPNWDGIGEPREDRIKYYQLHDILDCLQFPGFGRLNTLFVTLQKIFRVNRLQDISYFGGIVYFSINKKAMQYLLTEWNRTKFLYKHTFCCEETVPQTILMNSPDELKNSLVNFDLRYMLWEYKHGDNPGYLDEDDFLAIRSENYFFARKFDSQISKKLIENLAKDIT